MPPAPPRWTDTPRTRVLVVDDDAALVAMLEEELSEEGYQVEGETDANQAVTRILDGDYDLVVTDIEMPVMRGVELMQRVHERRPNQLILLMTAFGTIESAVDAVRRGACDFVTKPFSLDVLVLAIERALRERQMRREIVKLRSALGSQEPDELVARSPVMRQIVELARRAAASDSTVLLTGESGVGKSAVAIFIHRTSPRAAGPFLQLNCAALPGELAEAELFGARRGAFTGAVHDRAGLFVQANGGTLFLDEVGEMPLNIQPKLLQALESRRVRPVGATSEVDVDVRIIAATNRPLEDALKERRFRPDLYYRLNVVRLEIPPLRDRAEDVPALVEVLFERATRAHGKRVVGISTEAMRYLCHQPWPGNVRQLSNAIERAVVLTPHDVLTLEDVAVVDRPTDDEDLLDRAVREQRPLRWIENAYIHKVLDSAEGNKTLAARILDIDRRTLYRRLEEDEGPDGNGG